jgi:hypothetical protein
MEHLLFKKFTKKNSQADKSKQWKMIKEMMQSHCLIVSEKCLFYRDDNVSENEAAVEAICSVC